VTAAILEPVEKRAVKDSQSSKQRTIDFFIYFARRYPRRTLIMTALLLLAGFAEGLGIVTLLPILEAVQGEGGPRSRVGQLIVSAFNQFGVDPRIEHLLALIVFTALLSSFFLWAAMKQVGYTVAHVTADLRLTLLERLTNAKWSYFVDRSKGALANSISLEATRSSLSYRQACSFLAAVFETAIYAALALAISWRITLLAVVAGGALALILRGFITMARSAGEEETRLVKSLTARLVDTLNGLKSIRAMGREQQLLPLMRHEIAGLHAAEQRNVLAAHTLALLQQPLVSGMLAIGLYALLRFGDQPLSTVLVVAFLFHRLLGKVNTLQQRYQGVTFGESAFWSLRNAIDSAAEAEEVIPAAAIQPTFSSSVEFRDVSFAYQDTLVVDRVSFTIEAGQFVAIVGPSGSGKTTIADLLVGLHRPASGEIRIDGVSLAEVDLRAWRRKIGYVPQDTLLFHDSIMRNVTLGDESISGERVEAALRAADAWDFVSRRPAGLNEIIGEGGSKLSGGQRQRIAIARALVGNPSLLVLDEATTALDPATEEAICSTLRKLAGNVTIVAISHQAALQNAADVVYRLEKGRLTPLPVEDAAPMRLEVANS